jgi:phosphocarrier protein
MRATTVAKTLEIKNRLGLHARAAAQLVQTASRFQAEVTVTCDAKVVPAKSILSLMTLAAAPGTKVEIRATGKDASEAVAAIEALIERKFGEE